MFTANPITGSLDETIINASWGLGEAIVSGLVSPDTITARKKDGEILELEIGPKALKIEYAENGGTVELETPVEMQDVPALTKKQVVDLVHHRLPN